MVNKSSLVAVVGGICLSTGVLGSSDFHGYDHTVTPSLSYANLTSHLDTIIARGYLKVGTTGDYKPFTYLVPPNASIPTNTTTNATATYIGADIDAALSLSSALALPHPPQLIRTAWANITTDLLAGRFDIAMGGVSITLARARTAQFSTPVQTVGKTACVRCADRARYGSLAALNQPGVRVAVNPGGTNEAFDRAQLPAATLVLVADNNAVYDAVARGAADAMVSDRIEVELQVRLWGGVLCAVNPEAAFNFEELGYAVGRDAVWKGFVDLWVRQMVGGGEWNRTLERWLDYAWPRI